MSKARIIPNKIGKLEILVLSTLLCLTLFTHFYKLFSYFNLTGDPGRDAVVVYDIIINKKLTLIGPKASAGGFYYGPWYFYLLVPFFLLTKLDPIAALLLSIIIGILTVFLIYLITKEIFGQKVAFFSSFLYAVSPFVIEQVRRGWNPSSMPFFPLLCFYFFYKFLKEGKIKFLVYWGISFGLGLHFHFSLIFSLPVYLSFFFLLKKTKGAYKGLVIAIIAILFFFLPVFIFEIRHNFITTKSFISFLFFGVEKGKIYHPPMSISYYFYLISWALTSLIFVGEFKNFLFFTFFIIFGLVFFLKRKEVFKDFAFLYLLILFFGSLFVLGFYKGPVHPYYWVFVLPFPFIIVGYLLGEMGSVGGTRGVRGVGDLGRVISLVLFFLIFWQNLKNAPFWQKPKRTIKEEKEAAKIIALDAKNFDDINIVMFSNLDAAHSAFEYRYLVKYYGKEVLPAEDYKKAEKLYVVAENDAGNLLESPVMEIRDFRPRKIERRWETKAGYMIYRLGK